MPSIEMEMVLSLAFTLGTIKSGICTLLSPVRSWNTARVPRLSFNNLFKQQLDCCQKCWTNRTWIFYLLGSGVKTREETPRWIWQHQEMPTKEGRCHSLRLHFNVLWLNSYCKLGCRDCEAAAVWYVIGGSSKSWVSFSHKFWKKCTRGPQNKAQEKH